MRSVGDTIQVRGSGAILAGDNVGFSITLSASEFADEPATSQWPA